jgi:hypothetical protein
MVSETWADTFRTFASDERLPVQTPCDDTHNTTEILKFGTLYPLYMGALIDAPILRDAY